MDKHSNYSSVDDMERLIQLGVEELIADTKKTEKKKRKRKRRKTKKSFDDFDVPVKSNLIKADPTDKYSRFNGGDKDPLSKPLEKDHKKRTPSADAMSSSLGDGETAGGSDGLGWGVSGWGVQGFGESINSQKSKFIEYVNNLYGVNDVESADLLLSQVVKGYKTVFDDLEAKTTVFTMGMQPSFSKFFEDKIDDYVFALNTFMGEIVCIYVGESNGLESLDDMKDWYLHIGVNPEVIEKIIFIEKSTPRNDSSMIDLEFDGKSGELDNSSDVLQLVSLCDNAILVGCFDLYFAFDFMLALSKLKKRFEVDKRFSFLVEE